MITDLLKNGNYKQFRIVTFVRDWVIGIFVMVILEAFAILSYSFSVWEHPLKCINYSVCLYILRGLILVMFIVSIYFNKFSYKEDIKNG